MTRKAKVTRRENIARACQQWQRFHDREMARVRRDKRRWAMCYFEPGRESEPVMQRHSSRAAAVKMARDVSGNPYMRVVVVQIVKEWMPRKKACRKSVRRQRRRKESLSYLNKPADGVWGDDTP